MKDFVFKYDVVRVVQIVIKYSIFEQRCMIVQEFMGIYVQFVESCYVKFFIGKFMVVGDKEICDLIIFEFYGKVRKFINYFEVFWIFDDIYW